MADKRDVVVLSAVRSAMGFIKWPFFSGIEPAELGGMVMKEAVSRSGVDPQQINYVTVGNCIPTEARSPMWRASLDPGRATHGICGDDGETGYAAQVCKALCPLRKPSCWAIAIIVSAAVWKSCRVGVTLRPAMRSGARMGDTTMVNMMVAALTDPFGVGHMGITAENLAAKWHISREEQDAFAVESQRRAATAIAEGRFKSQIVPIIQQTRKGEVVFDTDEYVKAGTTLEMLGKMKPAFKKDGSVTAGNASGINDAASFFVLAAADAAAKAGQKPIARLVAYAVAGVPMRSWARGRYPLQNWCSKNQA